MTHNPGRQIAAAALLALFAPLSWAQAGHHMMSDADKLSWAAVPSLPKGAQITVLEGPMNEAVPFTARIKFPANFQIPPHWHPAIEHVTVLSGTFNMGTGDSFDRSKTQALNAGGFAVMPTQTRHFAWTATETVIQVHGVGPWGLTYVNPTDDPRAK